MLHFFISLTLLLVAEFSLSSAPTKIHCDLKPVVRHRSESRVLPLIHLYEGTSLNWAGYAAAANMQSPQPKSVMSASGSWIVPAVNSSQSNKTYSSIWVGIDGYVSGSVEQIGTEQDWDNGVQKNFAWFEMYPAIAYKIVGFPVDAGDKINAAVAFVGNATFKLTITNKTKNVTYTVPQKYTKSQRAKRSSAEWIVEAPYLNGILPLADFDMVSFTKCSATINNIKGSISNPNWQYDALTMASPNNIIKALPTPLSADGRSFSVLWQHE